jgi:YHS domain-containing protein
MKRPNTQRCFKDPVCGMVISRMTAIEEFVYQGKSYYFCAGICKDVFEAEPERYISRHRQHGIKSM